MLLYLDIGVQVVIQVFFMALCNNVDQHSADTGQQKQWRVWTSVKHWHIFFFASLAEQKLFFVIKDDKGLINQVQNQKSIKNYKSGVLNSKWHPNYVFYHIHWTPTLMWIQL